MENAGRTSRCRSHRLGIGYVCLDNLKARIASMLLEVGPAANDKTVEDPNRAPHGNQAIDEMAADEPGAAGYKVDASVGQSRSLQRSCRSTSARTLYGLKQAVSNTNPRGLTG